MPRKLYFNTYLKLDYNMITRNYNIKIDISENTLYLQKPWVSLPCEDEGTHVLMVIERLVLKLYLACNN